MYRAFDKNYIYHFPCSALRLLLCKETSPETWRHLLLHRNHFEDRCRLHEETVAREQQVIVGRTHHLDN